ncbi:DNA polymerase delta, subunit 4-domain-containing protein [Sphaerosporella brunnea]|uniref:DNA polymerase delta, subunit 4-domain-containing protein n=1 Tax=Sphaerosporella brunnea TaxID=1250544 RepID=A0A5J5EHB3_9PEZI|nr:DNA polymerase delta, subunit 4-domain-containing protein [Sphaerosporella brunnea]
MAPPKRSNRTVRQSTLSFKTKVTKSAPNNSAFKKGSSSSGGATTPSSSQVVCTIDDSSQERAISRKPVKIPKSTTSSSVSSKEEQAAREVSSARLKKFYAAILESRLTAPVHQNSLTLEEKILRHFDLSSQYGPCIGITRAGRWKRAHRLGLRPPIEVLAVALQMEDEMAADHPAEKRDTRRAYIDDFLSTRNAGE